MGSRQYTTPLVIRQGKPHLLSPVPRNESYESEDALQKLIFQYPSVLPMAEIEPAFSKLIAVAQELPTPNGGSIDLFFIDTDGHIIIVETKLWRNPDSRRKVVGQVVDYATSLAGWSYQELRTAVKKCTASKSDDPLLALAKAAGGPDIDGRRFKNAISLNLERGRFLLLIVGDGVQEGVEQMVGFRLVLVELALYRLGKKDDEIYLQPRVVAATREVVRAIVEVRGAPSSGGVVVCPPPESEVEAKRGRSSLGEEEFYAALRAANPEAVPLVKDALREAMQPGHELVVDWGGANGPILKWYFGEGKFDYLNFGQLAPDGTLAYTGWLSAKSNRAGLPDSVWREYYRTIAALLGRDASVHEYKDDEGTSNKIVDSKGKDLKALPLLQQKRAWFQAIDETIARAQKAFAAKS